MKRSGSATLWLAEGFVPHFREMVELGREVVRALSNEFGPDAVVKRFADPFWLTSFACVLGFEWNTSGQTTVAMKAVKHGLSGTEIPVRVLGGKGSEMRAAQLEAAKTLGEIGVKDVGEIRRVSRLTCCVDDAAVQDSYDVYFHASVVSETGRWTVVNQGMNIKAGTARRYHWSSDVGAVVEEPHAGIVCERVEEVVLDMTSRHSAETRKTILEMLSDTPPSRLNEDLSRAKALMKKQTLLEGDIQFVVEKMPDSLIPPKRFDEEALRRAKNVRGFEELLTVGGVGPATVRGLAYVACLVYGSRVSWRDPVKYAYAFGTKSGKPYPVDRRAMVESAAVLRDAVLKSKMGEGEKIAALRRLSALVDEVGEEQQPNH
ncbi:MAG: DUF763 domain-containing protein [Candidatus Caldarchaeum sp.]|nr:DUF763 domain-containing protein [Candidatus Caldarchaeum sp.]MDW8359651.1 DUF763 domain-containing protein [Candidatus Caldarchaeum sp.]